MPGTLVGKLVRWYNVAKSFVCGTLVGETVTLGILLLCEAEPCWKTERR